MSARSIDILGDFIQRFVNDRDVQVDVDRKFVIHSVGKHPNALDAFRRIKMIAKDRLLTKDGAVRAHAARALEKQFGYVVGNFSPVGAGLKDYIGIYTPIGIILLEDW
jgi:hypothetical protein